MSKDSFSHGEAHFIVGKKRFEAGHNLRAQHFLQDCMSPSEDSDQPSHPRSLIRVNAGHPLGSQGSKASSGRQLKL